MKRKPDYHSIHHSVHYLRPVSRRTSDLFYGSKACLFFVPEEDIFFIIRDIKYSCPLLWMKIESLYSNSLNTLALCSRGKIISMFQDIFEQSLEPMAVHVSAHQMCRNVRDSWSTENTRWEHHLSWQIRVAIKYICSSPKLMLCVFQRWFENQIHGYSFILPFLPA